MKKLSAWLKKNKDIVGIALHTIWLGVSFGILDMNQTQQIAGHGIIGSATGVGVIQRYNRNKEKIDNAIKKVKNIVARKNKK